MGATAGEIRKKRLFLGSGDAGLDRVTIEDALQAQRAGMTFGELRSKVQTVSEKDLRLHIVGLIARGSVVVTKQARIKYSKRG